MMEGFDVHPSSLAESVEAGNGPRARLLSSDLSLGI
jgi:hypothetical protein